MSTSSVPKKRGVTWLDTRPAYDAVMQTRSLDVQFSADLINKIKAEAGAIGIRSPSAISVALREQLVAERDGHMDGRARDYYVAARVVDRGIAFPLPGAIKITGLDEISRWAELARAHALPSSEPLDPGCGKAYIPAARVSLTRNGHAHFTVLLKHSKQPPDVPDSWVDLYVYKTEAEAAAKAKSSQAGKVF